jgi:hypothetical protein
MGLFSPAANAIDDVGDDVAEVLLLDRRLIGHGSRS